MRSGFLLVLALVCASEPVFAAPSAPSATECIETSERAQVVRDRGELTAASELFAICSNPACPGPIQVACVRWRQATIASTPTVVLLVRNDRDEDVIGAEYSFDQGKVAGAVSGHPIALDPGTHGLAVRAEGYATTTTSVLLSQGEKERLLRIRLDRPAARAPTTTRPPPTVPVAPPNAPSGSSADASSLRVPLGIGLTTLATGGLVGSLVLGLGVRSELSDLEASACGASRTCSEDTADGLRTRLVVADVLLGAAIVAGVAAAWVWLSSPTPRASAQR